MRSFKSLLLFCCIFLSANKIFAQALSEKQLQYLSDHNIELIDSNKLFHSVLKDNGKVKVLITFTNYCVGTPYVFSNMAKLKQHYGDTTMDFILCSSAPRNEYDDLVAVLKKYSFTDKLYLIDPAKYKDKSDDRKKGFAFRNDICKLCTKDEIGTPYYIFFNEKNEVMFAGYYSRNDFEKMLGEHFAATKAN